MSSQGNAEGKRDSLARLVQRASANCAVSRTALLRGQPVILVSNDALILDAARAADMKARVLSLQEYQEVLGRGSQAFDELRNSLIAGS